MFMPEGPSLGIVWIPILILCPVMHRIAGVATVLGSVAVMLIMDMLDMAGPFFFLIAFAFSSARWIRSTDSAMPRFFHIGRRL